MFSFATCDRNNALKFLRKLNPSINLEDSAESAGDLLDIIAADELRVCDPDFHSGEIIEGKNFSAATVDRAMAALEKAGIPFARQ